MLEFSLRKAKREDLDAIDTVFSHGREYLRGQGLPQWQNGYGPTKEAAAGDIERGEGFVTVNGEGTVCGYAALIKGIDKCYTAIRPVDRSIASVRSASRTNDIPSAEFSADNIPGAWDEAWPEYVSVHRVALSSGVRGKGFAKVFMAELISEAAHQGFHDIRIDTHERNVIMRRVIENAGFILRGEVEFPFPNGDRLAYQLLVSYNQFQ